MAPTTPEVGPELGRWLRMHRGRGRLDRYLGQPDDPNDGEIDYYATGLSLGWHEREAAAPPPAVAA